VRRAVELMILDMYCIHASGHNASFWIDRFTSQEIARVLQEESSTTQDIAARFALIYNKMWGKCIVSGWPVG